MEENEHNLEIIKNVEDSSIFYKEYNINKKNNKLPNILNKYERTKVIMERYNMLSNGCIPLISDIKNTDTIYDIVIKELNEKKIPFIIKRELNGNYEYLKLEEFIIL